MMTMIKEIWCEYPFTMPQLQELELQTLIFNYIASGVPIPSHIINPFRRTFALEFFSFHPSLSFPRKAVEEDPEPWRCKRTDGKKWRCSREAYGESKYCERHKHRGKRSVNKSSNIAAEMGLTLYSHPSDAKQASYFSNIDTHPCQFESSKCFNEHENWEEKESWVKKKEKEEHCFVFGADLRSQKPLNDVVEDEDREVQCPKLGLGLFSEFPNISSKSWMNGS